jgi:hypothetical protein
VCSEGRPIIGTMVIEKAKFCNGEMKINEKLTFFDGWP